MKRIFSVLAMLCPFFSMGQPITINGKIISEQSEPIAGATITIKGTNQSTTSNSRGGFTLRETGLFDTLVVSSVGYEPQEVPNNERGLHTVILRRKATALQEVTVSTGYQQLPKERATGSFTQLDNALLNQQVSTSILDRLESIANGLSINRKISASGQLMVRGLSSIRGPRDPLIVLDNFPFDGDPASINPADVESITILKDAAAASIWGTRAGNGVIVITTKKGRYNQPLRIEATMNTVLTDPPHFSYLPRISSSDFIDVEQFLFSKGYRFSDTAATSRPIFSPVYEILFRQRRGELSAVEANAQIDALRSHDVLDDFRKYSYRQAVNRQYAVSLRGGAPNTAWLLSAGCDDNKSNLDEEYRRLSFRLENSVKAWKNAELSAGIWFTRTATSNGRPAMSDVSTSRGQLPPYTRLLAGDGTPLPLYHQYRQTYIDSVGGGRLLDWKYYPFDEHRHISQSSTVQDFLANLGLNYRLAQGLSASVQYQYQQQQSIGRNLYGEESYFVRNLVNQYAQINWATGAVTRRIPEGAILDLSHNRLAGHKLRGQLSWNKEGRSHRLSAIAGAELRHLGSTGESFRTYGYDSEILTSVPVDYTTTYPTYPRGSLAYIPNASGFNDQANRFVSLYTNAAYTWKQRYTLSASARRDASNTFGVRTNDKWTPLWSAGIAWDISREGFYTMGALPFLKLRATYGYSGNVDPSLSAFTTMRYSSTSPYTGTPYARIDKFYNPDLRWEKVGTLNLGLDFKTAGELLTGSIEWYQKKATDLYAAVPIDYTAGLGVTTITKNAAAIRAQGMDIDLMARPLKGPLQWTAHLTVSTYTDRVVDYYLASDRGSNFVTGGTTFTGIKGRPLYGVYSYRWGGLDGATGDPLGYLDGQLSTNYAVLTGPTTTYNDLVYSGPSFPKVFGSLGNTVSWRNISLTARLMYKFGYYFRRASINYSSLFNSADGHSDYSLRWQKPGDEAYTYVPSLTYPLVNGRDAFYNNSEILVEKGDHIRLQYINLEYRLEKERWKALPFRQLQVYTVVSNPGLLWSANKEGLDPDYDNGAIPPTHSVAFGLRLTL